MRISAWKADLFQSPRLQDAEGKRGHSRTQSSQIPPVEPDSERQSGMTGHTGEGIPGASADVRVADGSQAPANRGDTTPPCGFCKGQPVYNAASWFDGKPRPPAACPRCGETNYPKENE